MPGFFISQPRRNPHIIGVTPDNVAGRRLDSLFSYICAPKFYQYLYDRFNVCGTGNGFGRAALYFFQV